MSRLGQPEDSLGPVAWRMLGWCAVITAVAELMHMLVLFGVFVVTARVTDGVVAGTGQAVLLSTVLAVGRWPAATAWSWRSSAVRLSPEGWRGRVLERRPARPVVSVAVDALISVFVAVVVGAVVGLGGWPTAVLAALTMLAVLAFEALMYQLFPPDVPDAARDAYRPRHGYPDG